MRRSYCVFNNTTTALDSRREVGCSIVVLKADLSNEAIWARSTCHCVWHGRADGRTDAYVREPVVAASLRVQSTTRRYVLRWFFLRVSLDRPGEWPTGSSVCINPPLLPMPQSPHYPPVVRYAAGIARQRGGSPSITSKWKIVRCCLYENNRQQNSFVTRPGNIVQCCLVVYRLTTRVDCIK